MTLSREELLCQWAIEEGFDRAGIASLEQSRYTPAFQSWIGRGDNASMEWLGRRIEDRTQPASRLDGARSAVCVALHYPARDGHDNDLWQGVARYAHGDDYHSVMMQSLRNLGDRIERSFPGTKSRSYVDTGPILERELGERAGLGRIAKNTMLLSRQGSYFLLGEVLLTLDLEPAETLPDLCGNCTRCLDACPTGALPEAYRLDARRCISFWTIEHRGVFPEGVAESLGEWSFGCDICQQVCPWNSDRNPRRQGADPESLKLPEQRGELDLVGLASLERERYTPVFRGSALKRPKLEGLRRNAVAVLANRAVTLIETAGSAVKEADAQVVAMTDGLVQAVVVACRPPASPSGQEDRSSGRSAVEPTSPEQVVLVSALAALQRVAIAVEKAGRDPMPLDRARAEELERLLETEAASFKEPILRVFGRP